MPRLLFEKTGDSIWMSHLDLMRVFQRAFKRAGLPLTHTQGFNPRPSVSIALPLSVGVSSRCELLDFDLEGEWKNFADIAGRLNEKLVSGVRVLDAYETGAKIRNLAFLDCKLSLSYDRGFPDGAPDDIRALFARSELLVEKHSKNGVQQQDIIPMIRQLTVEQEGNMLFLNARVCCQNPTLNPMQLSAAIDRFLPELKPDFVRCERIEIYDQNNHIFR